MSFVIDKVTVSINLSDKEYGKGHEFFQNVSARASDHMNGGGFDLERANEVVDASLVMFLTAWQGVLTQKFAKGDIKGAELKTLLAATEARIDNVRKMLHRQSLEKQIGPLNEPDQSHP